MGNLVGDDEEMAYSIVLLPFQHGRRVSPAGIPGALQSFSVLRRGRGEAYFSGECDEYGEWEAYQSPLGRGHAR